MQFTDYHIFQQLSKETNQLLHKNFLDDQVSILGYRSKLLDNFRFKLKFSQMEPQEQTNNSSVIEDQVQSLGQAKFFTSFNNFFFTQHFDSQATFRSHIYYKFTNYDNLTLYWKLKTNQHIHENSMVGAAYKAHDNFIARLQVQLKTLKFYWGFKTWYRSEVEKINLGASIQWLYSKETNLKLAKGLGWFHYQDLKMNMIYKENGYSEFQLFKKYSDDFAIVYEFIRQPSEITYQYQKHMRFATQFKLSDRVDLSLKIDDRFKGQTSLKIRFDENIKLLLINKIDLDVRSVGQMKKISQFPIGFQFYYEKQ